MGLKKIGAKILAKLAYPPVLKANINGVKTQKEVLANLISTAKNTKFGKDHGFNTSWTQKEFSNNVPVRDYEGLKSYVELVKEAEADVLWPGLPIYFAKTSGTTSGAKYIPITKESMPEHIKAARNALLAYVYHTGKADFTEGKMIFLQGSPVLEKINGIQLGRLSGIVAHFVPKYLQSNRLPSWETNCIEEWEDKVKAIATETKSENLTLISGIPPWVKMYYEELIHQTGKQNIEEVFPNFSLFVYGGVNFQPYKDSLEALVGKPVDSVELFPASEGFFAFQDLPDQKGMLLNLNAGMYFEFIPLTEYGKEKAKRLGLEDVKVGEDYALIISSNAGLWAYDIGDVVRFTELKPYRVIVSGRTKHYTSAFGEHVIATEVEQALQHAVSLHPCQVTEFTVAPCLNPSEGKARHQWFIEFKVAPEDIKSFQKELDKRLGELNSYYLDLIDGKVLESLEIIELEENAFIKMMKAEGKLGGQNKAPRLSNSRKYADKLVQLTKKSYRSSN